MPDEKEDHIEEILELIDEIPPMPENIVKLRQICANSNSSFKDIMPILEKDPGFCADILHMANSAYYAVNHRVESVNEAVRYIGFNSVVDLVSISFSNNIVKKYFSGIKNLNQYFTHSNQIALATKMLAKAAQKNTEEQDFYATTGLLHDIGRLIIMMVSDSEIRDLIGHSWQEHPDLITKETTIFGINHCVVGKRICEKWHFSQAMQDAILHHHAPLKHGLHKEATFILLAHFISMENMTCEQIFQLFPENVFEKLGLSLESLRKAKNLYTATQNKNSNTSVR